MLSFFNDTATTEIYTLSLHDALPIYHGGGGLPHDPAPEPPAPQVEEGDRRGDRPRRRVAAGQSLDNLDLDRKSTRLNSSHANISYAVFCFKKKQKCVHSTFFRVCLIF